jgi:hypothetical protein
MLSLVFILPLKFGFDTDTSQGVYPAFYIQENGGSKKSDLSMGNQIVTANDYLAISLKNTGKKMYKIQTVEILIESSNKTRISDYKKIWRRFENQNQDNNNTFIIPINSIGSNFYKLSIKITSVVDKDGSLNSGIPANKAYTFYVRYSRN